MIIFEGEELFLHYHEGISDYILITFASADQTEKAQSDYFLKPIVEKYNLSCLGITTKFDNYYQHSDMYSVISLCNEISQKYTKIILVGLSMAAYAALKFSAALHANIVFAMGGRYTLDAKVASVSGIMQRTVDRLDPHSIIETTIQPDEVSGKLYIAHDTYHGVAGYNAIDHEHIGKIMEHLPNTVLVPVLFAHHLVINSLKGSEEFKAILDALDTEEDTVIIKQVVKIRRHHINNIYNKIMLLRCRYPLLVYQLLTSRSLSLVKNNYILYDNHENNLVLIYNLCIKGFNKQSRELLRLCFLRAFLKCSFYEAENINKTHITNAQTYPSDLPYLIAITRYMLVYDLTQKKIIAVRDFVYSAHHLPLRLYGDRSDYRVVCIWEDMVFELRYNQSEISIRPLTFDDQTAETIIVQSQENTVSLFAPDHQYCLQVNQDGDSQFVMVEPKEWEQFAVV